MVGEELAQARREVSLTKREQVRQLRPLPLTLTLTSHAVAVGLQDPAAWHGFSICRFPACQQCVAEPLRSPACGQHCTAFVPNFVLYQCSTAACKGGTALHGLTP